MANFDIDVQTDEVTISGNPGQIMYDALRFVIDKLWNVCNLFLSAISDITADNTLWFALPSGASFQIAHININTGLYETPDFRLPAQTVSQWVLKLPGFTFNYSVTWKWIYFWEIIFPKLANVELTSSNIYWRNGDTYTLGDSLSPARHYRIADLTLDAAVFTILGLVIAGLIHLGMGKHAEQLQKVVHTSTTVNQTVSAVANAQKIASIVTKTDTLQEAMDDVTDTVDTTNINVIDIVSKSTSIASNATAILTKLDDIGIDISDSVDHNIIKAKIEEIKLLLANSRPYG